MKSYEPKRPSLPLPRDPRGGCSLGPPAFLGGFCPLVLGAQAVVSWKTLTSTEVRLDLKDNLSRSEKQLCKYINELSKGLALCSPYY